MTNAPLRPELEACVTRLVAQVGRGGNVSLSEFAEVLGTLQANADDVDRMFTRLEQHEIQIATVPVGSLMPLLARVLEAARTARAQGQKPSATSLAATLQVPESQVRAALLLSRTLAT